jgi:hypothetical protein
MTQAHQAISHRLNAMVDQHGEIVLVTKGLLDARGAVANFLMRFAMTTAAAAMGTIRPFQIYFEGLYLDQKSAKASVSKRYSNPLRIPPVSGYRPSAPRFETGSKRWRQKGWWRIRLPLAWGSTKIS